MKITTHVSVENLLVRLRENRKKHLADHKEALDNYRTKAREMLREKLHELDAADPPQCYVSLPRPVSYEHDYDSVIAMLEASVAEKIELSLEDFRRLMEDQWEWKPSFVSVAKSYSSEALLRARNDF